jgi:hypothetical protein
MEKEDLLRKSTTALLGNFIAVSSNYFLFNFIDFPFFCFCFLQELSIFLQILKASFQPILLLTLFL